MRFSFTFYSCQFDCLSRRVTASSLRSTNALVSVKSGCEDVQTDYVHSPVSLIILLLCNLCAIVYLEMTTHVHKQAEYTQERGQPEGPRPQTPYYFQNDDVTTAISISHLDPGHLKPSRQLLCNMLFGSRPAPSFVPIF